MLNARCWLLEKQQRFEQPSTINHQAALLHLRFRLAEQRDDLGGSVRGEQRFA